MYFLMTRKTTEAYQHVLDTFKGKLCQTTTISYIMTDYEKALRRAIRTVFPNIQLMGCWFHFSKAIYKKAKSLNLYGNNTNFAMAVKMTMALPLLPANLISDGITAVTNSVTEYNINFTRFCTYLRTTWANENISVFQQSHRTNNAIESFHRSFFRIVGTPHPNVWIFIDNLKEMENAKASDLIRLNNGVAARRNRNRNDNNHRRSQVIATAQATLTADGNVDAFLRSANTREYQILFRSLSNYESDDLDAEYLAVPEATSSVAVIASSSGAAIASSSGTNLLSDPIENSESPNLSPISETFNLDNEFPDLVNSLNCTRSCLCCICYINTASHIFANCGHFGICSICVGRFTIYERDEFHVPPTHTEMCPICRVPITILPQRPFIVSNCT